MIKTLTGIAFKGGINGRPALFHIKHYYTSFATIAGIPALHGLILTELNR
jgi:hypothetical protein